ncbi:MAG: SDR family oxidoreductase [Flavipsychrobacter sp.]|nr:SDR family oxidoreductase [Flavipsychrobacter sp.]
MILVTGANGNLGAATINFLLKKIPAENIRALVRSEEKGITLKEKGIEIALGDYFNSQSLASAMKGIDTLMLVSASSVKDRYQQHANAINAAKEAGVRHIVYSSILKASPNTKFAAGLDHVNTEADIENSGIDYTIMRNTYYSDFLPMILGDFRDSGQVFYSAGDAKINFALRADMAEANANVLADPSAHRNKVYNITSSATYSFNDIAGMLTSIVKKPITYIDIPLNDLNNGMLQHGIPVEVAEMLTSIAASMRDGEFDYADNTLSTLIEHKPLDLKDFLASIYSL